MSNMKTNAMRILDLNNIEYQMFSYKVIKDHVDGVEAAKQIGKDVKEVYKTLVVRGTSKNIYICVIPVAENLDFKKVAKTCGEKNIEMINVSEINKITGYIRGGCSPIGMKKKYITFIDDTARVMDKIIVSAGKVGYQVQLQSKDLQAITDAKYAKIIK